MTTGKILWTNRQPTDEEIRAAEEAARRAAIPQVVTMRQARLALLSAGLLHTVDAAIDSIADPTIRAAAQIEWEYAATIDRNSPLIHQLAPALGMTEAQMDALFIAAVAL